MEQTSFHDYHKYRKPMLGILILGYLIGIFLLAWNLASGIFIGGGVIFLLVEACCVLALDWRGATSLRGTTKLYIMNKGVPVSTRPSYALAFLFFPEIMLPMYLIHTIRDMRQIAHRQQKESRLQVATLEAQLGILPPTEGTCRDCHKPLQIGAEFCQYCGVSVIERPKICPACAVTTLPDAVWCPRCRTKLP